MASPPDAAAAAPKPSSCAANQYSTTTANLTARIAIHAYSTNPQNWFSWLGSRIPLAGRNVLDIGAGTGELWRRVDHTPAQSLALVDASPAMCARLREIPRAIVRQADAGRLPFANASFDTAVAIHMLYHVDDPTATLREFARVLRLGGTLFVSLGGPGYMSEISDILFAVGRSDFVPGAALNNVNADTGPELIERWFQDVVVEEFPGDLEVPTVEPVLAQMESFCKEPLTAEQVRAARELIEAKIKAEGCFRIKKRVVLITALRGVI